MIDGVGVADAGVVTPAEAADTARALASLLPAPLVPLLGASFIRSDRLHDEFVTRLALGVLRDAGLADAARHAGTVEEITTRAGLDPGRALIPVDWILRRLAARGLVEAAGDVSGRRRFRMGEAPVGLDPAPLREAQAREDPAALPSYTLAETVARDYPAFLRGERAGEAVLFSPARLRLWLEYFSNDNTLYAVNNRVGAIAAAQWLPPGKVAVLELGGGLGSAALALVAALEAAGRAGDVAQYRFTDVVPAFLRRGQQALTKAFADMPWAFATLDMDRPLREQGVAPGSCSLVYAVNTLHVARDLLATLGDVKDALAAGGRLVIAECVRLVPGQTLYAEFVFNLLESFRAPALDPTCRPNGGFLTPEHWRSAMEAAGFTDVRFLPDVERIRSFPEFSVMAIGATRP
jgi:SAM-dependent methyltransferase